MNASNNAINFLNDLEKLLIKYKAAIASRKDGDYSRIHFQLYIGHGDHERIESPRCHLTAHDVRGLIKNTSQFNEDELAMYGMELA